MFLKSRVIFQRIWIREGGNQAVSPGWTETVDTDFPIEFEGNVEGDNAPFRISTELRGAPAHRPETLGIDPSLAGAKAARRKITASLIAHRAGGGQPPGETVPVEVHLPCCDRRTAVDWRQEASPARVTEDGAIYLQDPGLNQARAAAALAVLFQDRSATAPFHFRFSDLRTVDRESALYQLPPVLERYGLSSAWTAWMKKRSGHLFDVSLLVRLKADAARGWAEVPGPRQAAFHERLIQVSHAVQSALRVWLTYVFFQDFAQYRIPAKSWPLLVYGAMKPFRGRSRADYTYEVTDPAAVQRALWGVLPSLEDEMRRIAPRLAPLPLALQQCYSQRRTPEMAREAAKLPRLFGSLLFGEREIVEAFLRFAHHMHETVRADKDSGIVKVGSMLHRKVAKQLASMYQGVDFSCLAPVILIEAAAALASATGYAAPVEAMLRIRDREEGVSYYGANSSFTG